jgi:hypothetical protein
MAAHNFLHLGRKLEVLQFAEAQGEVNRQHPAADL